MSRARADQPCIEALGDSALLIRLGDRIEAELNASALALAAALRAEALPGIGDIAPAYASVGMRYDPGAWIDPAGKRSPHENITAYLAEIVYKLQSGASAGSRSSDAVGGNGMSEAGKPLEIPVCYGGAFGPDLDALAAHTGLDADEIAARHARADYRVAMLGFMPGFAYLLGLDASLHAPRRASPRTRVPAGSVAIGGAQTGIYPRELPGGWQLIGRTPLTLFDPAREPPALLTPGQHVHFRAIDPREFAALAP